MTDHTDHRREAKRLLADGDTIRAQVHALFAIHDALTDRAAADRYAANEAEQREAEPDPLDEGDHRDRIDANGQRWGRMDGGCWHHEGKYPHAFGRCSWTLQQLQGAYGPLAFAPEAAQEATGGDLSASEGESGAEEGGEADDAQKAILCPECDDHINMHNKAGCWHFLCVCPRTPEDVARALIEADMKVDAEFSRLVAVSTDPAAALRRAATMEAVGVTDDQAKLFAQILARGRLLPRDLQRLKAAVEQAGGRRG
ncbi:hypothetical protein [Tessaracoccus massiliensis]|uniref:hypothetical protein n=1 Tax=Tessaracoccus massiliensis TaxID=1522311 RepID=UPI00058B8950|nr:hypothetical protein [Tessaracoccus massiliensis]